MPQINNKPKFIKNFQAWFKIKPDLDKKNSSQILFKEGEIWWCSVGENIGSEISGKQKLFLRPVYIIKKFSSHTFTAIPLTSTKPKNGDSYFFKVQNKKQDSYLCLHQSRYSDKKRLLKKMETVSENKQKEILQAFLKLYS